MGKSPTIFKVNVGLLAHSNTCWRAAQVARREGPVSPFWSLDGCEGRRPQRPMAPYHPFLPYTYWLSVLGRNNLEEARIYPIWWFVMSRRSTSHVQLLDWYTIEKQCLCYLNKVSPLKNDLFRPSIRFLGPGMLLGFTFDRLEGNRLDFLPKVLRRAEFLDSGNIQMLESVNLTDM